VTVVDPRHELGAGGEEAACRLLLDSGYRILERNYRTRIGELDAIAFQDGQLVFVEVRTRSGTGFGSGAESVGPRKRRQMIRVAQVYLQQRKVDQRQTCRFDVVEMEPLPDGGWDGALIRDAFEVE
jgi:putative endonuclease